MDEEGETSIEAILEVKPEIEKTKKRSGTPASTGKRSNVDDKINMELSSGGKAEDDDQFIPDECLKNTTRVKAIPPLYQTNYGGPMNTNWFFKLKMSPDVQKAMCYPESLLMVTESGETIGKMYCTVSEAEWNGVSCLSVHSGSSGSFQDGLQCGTTVTGFVNSKFRILHEFIHEWAQIADKMFERKTYLIQEANTMHCRVVTVRDKKVTEDRVFLLSKLECQNLITESGNILFQRVIIQEKKTGEIILRTLTSSGDVVRCNYQVLGHGTEVIKGENITVFGIRRSVLENEGTKVWDSLFNYFGRLVLRCQPDNDSALVQLWFEAVNTPEILENTFGSRPPLLWACDMELYSKYITHKREKAGEYRTYLNDHPELRSLLSDFLQAVLQNKPTNLIGFASNYFEPWLQHQRDSQLQSENADKLSGIGAQDNLSGAGEYGWEGESAPKGMRNMYGVDPVLEEDNVLLEENPDYYLQERFQNRDENSKEEKEEQEESEYEDNEEPAPIPTEYNYAPYEQPYDPTYMGYPPQSYM